MYATAGVRIVKRRGTLYKKVGHRVYVRKRPEGKRAAFKFRRPRKAHGWQHELPAAQPNASPNRVQSKGYLRTRGTERSEVGRAWEPSWLSRAQLQGFEAERARPLKPFPHPPPPPTPTSPSAPPPCLQTGRPIRPHVSAPPGVRQGDCHRRGQHSQVGTDPSRVCLGSHQKASPLPVLEPLQIPRPPFVRPPFCPPAGSILMAYSTSSTST